MPQIGYSECNAMPYMALYDRELFEVQVKNCRLCRTLQKCAQGPFDVLFVFPAPETQVHLLYLADWISSLRLYKTL